MRRILPDTRREIIRLKLQGATNQEAAETLGVSKGTVSNVVSEARDGEFPPFDDLDEQLDSLIVLGKRLEEADLGVTDASIGLDVLEWLTELGVEPNQLAEFRDTLDRITLSDEALEQYATAAVKLQRLETHLGTNVEEELSEILTFISDKETDELRRLEACATAGMDLSSDLSELEQAIENAVVIQKHGFDLETAEQMAAEIADVESATTEDAIAELTKRYNGSNSLEADLSELRTEKHTLQDNIDSLEATLADLQSDRKELRQALARLEASHETLQESLESLEATKSDVQAAIETERDRVDSLRAEYSELEVELEAMETEREVVHSYRRFLQHREQTETLIEDVGSLLKLQSPAESPVLSDFEPSIRERVGDELVTTAEEWLDDEPVITIAEHEQRLEEASELERTLDELSQEVNATKAFFDFLETGELSADLLKEARDAIRGRGIHSDWREERKSDEVRQLLVEQLEAMTEDREVIDIDRHRSELQDCREQYLDYIETVVDANAKLASELRATQRSVDEAQVKAVATDVVSAFDEEVDISGEQLTEILIDGFSEEVERRVEQECQHRVRRAKQEGLAMAASRGVVAMPLDSPEDTGGQG